ncbi:hypothetical protein [Zobellia galactanivorans]|uniref:Uncharacterized protein n=1 Tax=Zobellia galactanivorans (strain DSM 12802 / CCUG 47099 / CIP 106680 / NCIMB 13871 / Dsij) TaxID=63186 RepID=G0L489_ZOBGA|nr:hypothetical protein [Zobellia galactanivorans]CAZ98730.1 Conserved hypothetical protein [Zobellia galactanivorans]
MKNKRIRVGINTSKKVKLESELQAKAVKWQARKTALDSINKSLKANFSTIEELNIFLDEKTGFPNRSMSALAFNIQDEYDAFVKVADATIDKGIFETDENGDLVKLKNGSFIFTKEAAEQIANDCGNYIEGERLEIYLKMKEFQKFYNSLDTRYRNGGGCRFQGSAQMTISEYYFAD